MTQEKINYTIAALMTADAANQATNYVASLTLPDWVYVITLLWLALQIGEKFYKWFTTDTKKDKS